MIVDGTDDVSILIEFGEGRYVEGTTVDALRDGGSAIVVNVRIGDDPVPCIAGFGDTGDV